MPRTARVTPEAIRATVLAMLAESQEQAPATRERFRRLVSVRKLRARLGAGDPATLGRALNALEAELVPAGVAQIAPPPLPPEIAEQMQAVWHAAVAVQLDHVVRLQREAQASVEAAEAARRESALRAELLQHELTDLRAAGAERERELAQGRAAHALLEREQATLRTQCENLTGELQAVSAREAARESAQREAIAAAQARYEGLARELLQETAQQRHAQQQEQARLASQLKFAERRSATLEAALTEARADAAAERARRENAAGEASALKAITASQRAQLDELVRLTVAAEEKARRRPTARTQPAPTRVRARKPVVARKK